MDTNVKNNNKKANNYIILKRNQFVGGIIGLIIGLCLILLGISDIANVEISSTNISINLNSTIGAVVIILSLLLIWRSGGGVKYSKTNNEEKKENIEYFSVDATKQDTLTKNLRKNSIICPICNKEIDIENLRLHCKCSCGKEWKQRIPS